MEALFNDKKMGTSRAAAQVCLPRLPGPSSHANSNSASLHSVLPGDPAQSTNDNLHQGDTHAARSSESFDLPSITR